MTDRRPDELSTERRCQHIFGHNGLQRTLPSFFRQLVRSTRAPRCFANLGS